MIPEICTKISSYFFSLIFPFFAPLMIAEHFSFAEYRLFIEITLFLSVIVLEAYIVHRMLKKPCTFIVPRMFIINFVAIGVQIITFSVCTVFFWGINVLWFGLTKEYILNIKFLSPETVATAIAYPLAILGLVGAIILFYVRGKVFCKMYMWFDRSVDQVFVRKTMLYAVFASYIFWIIIMMIEQFFKLNF
ncbi:hypothetical protein KBB68_03730 [Candidatus Babeliales bacterium]|nr:hypothetical protein [Candidatus Babeliales bacterium]